MPKKALFLLCVLMLVVVTTPVGSSAQVAVGVSVRFGPPVLPVYVQPPCPEPGWIWTPGYWAWGPDGYYWVPGAWVEPPVVGVLWTPGYWGFADGFYVWYPGYWGPHVGFYGGINYGFGYTGVGFVGGYWRGGNYFYNRAVTNVNVTVIHNTYVNNTVINRTVVNRVSYNGGRGGVIAQPNRFERQYAGERHIEATGTQAQHEHMASTNRSLLASNNHGRPSIAATSRAGEFSGRNVVAARQVNSGYRNFNHGNNNTASHYNQGYNSGNPGNNGSHNYNKDPHNTYARTTNGGNYARTTNGGQQYHGGQDHGGSTRGSTRSGNAHEGQGEREPR